MECIKRRGYASAEGDEKEILIFDYTNKGRTYKLVC
jgi:hypothetical protein